MKRTISVLAVLATIGLGLAACGSSSKSSSAGTPQRGGTLTMLGTGDVDYMDPNVSYYTTGYLALRMFSRQLLTYPAVQGQTTTIVPDLVATLLPGKEETIGVTITPPPDVSVGDYETTIKTEAFASNRKVDSEDKKIRIHVTSSANIVGTAALILLLVGILVGVVVFGVRLSRR